MPRQYCPTTGKQKFPDRLEAELAIADLHRSNSHNRHRRYRDEPTRSYRCGHCGGWHMTSQAKTENRASVGS